MTATRRVAPPLLLHKHGPKGLSRGAPSRGTGDSRRKFRRGSGRGSSESPAYPECFPWRFDDQWAPRPRSDAPLFTLAPPPHTPTAERMNAPRCGLMW